MPDETCVFVVDDDDGVRNSLSFMLADLDVPVHTFARGDEFLDAVGPTTTGCVLLDVRLPDVDGLEVLAQLAPHRARLPAIMISGYADVPMAVKAIKVGAIDFVEKPVDRETLFGIVERAIISSRTMAKLDDGLDDAKSKLGLLTPRERQVFEQLVLGNPNKVIAYELRISKRTVEVHRARVMEKLGARTLSHLVRIGLAVGFDDAPS